MKPWYKSSTIVLNILMAIGASYLSIDAGEIDLATALPALVATIFNIINRFRTTEPVTKPFTRSYYKGGE